MHRLLRPKLKGSSRPTVLSWSVSSPDWNCTRSTSFPFSLTIFSEFLVLGRIIQGWEERKSPLASPSSSHRRFRDAPSAPVCCNNRKKKRGRPFYWNGPRGGGIPSFGFSTKINRAPSSALLTMPEVICRTQYEITMALQAFINDVIRGSKLRTSRIG